MASLMASGCIVRDALRGAPKTFKGGEDCKTPATAEQRGANGKWCKYFFAVGRANDCRIDCKTATHSDGTSGTGVAPTREWPSSARAAVRSRCPRAALAARANIRRFVNLLQLLGRTSTSRTFEWRKYLPATMWKPRFV